MRTTEDLKLAIAILIENISTTKPHRRLVSSTFLFTTWQKSPSGEFASSLRKRIQRHSLEIKFDSLRVNSRKLDLLVASDILRDTLNAQSLSDGSVRALVKKADFRSLVWRSTNTPFNHERGALSEERLVQDRRVKQKPTPSTSTTKVIVGRPRMGGGSSASSFRETAHFRRGDSIKTDRLPKPAVAVKNRLKMEGTTRLTSVQPKEQFTRHMLHFGTDRLLNVDDEGNATFGDVRGEDKVTYGIASVSIPHIHKEGGLERPKRRMMIWPPIDEDPNKHIVIHKLTPLELSDWIRNSRIEEGEGLLFIHGFNVTFNEAVWRAAQICHDLKFSGLKLCYSWSSCGKVQSYATDEATVDWSEEHLRTFLTQVTTKLGLSRLHIIAHSMGNRALLGVLETWENLPGSTPISQVVLAAPDVDAGRFRQIARIFEKYEQVTLYASRADRAILASAKLRRLNRAGDASPPIVLKDLSTIDVTSAGAEMFGLGHSYFATSQTVFRDLYYIIKERFTPDRRAGIKICTLGYYELS